MLIYEELSKKVINAYYNVQRILGKGLDYPLEAKNKYPDNPPYNSVSIRCN